MSIALRKRYWAAINDRPEAPEQLCWEYSQWCSTLAAAHETINRFCVLMGTYPVIGDELHIQLPEPAYRTLGMRVTQRIVYTCAGAEQMQLLYNVEAVAEELKELEEYQEGDLVSYGE